jgi:hypothetical protein
MASYFITLRLNMSLLKYKLQFTLPQYELLNISTKEGEDLRFFSLKEETEVLDDIHSRISIFDDTNGNFDVFSDNDIEEPTEDFFVKVYPDGSLDFIDTVVDNLKMALHLLKSNKLKDVYLVCID